MLVEKTKVMTTGGSSCSTDINNMLVEVVSSFPYLGSLITDDDECTKDIRGRFIKRYLHWSKAQEDLAEPRHTHFYKDPFYQSTCMACGYVWL